MKQDPIEIICPHCREKNELQFFDSFADRKISCGHCGNTIIWKHCPECETGYVAESEKGQCPSCRPKLPFKKPRLTVDTKKCPWCGEKIHFGPMVLLDKMGIVQCPHCGKYSEKKRGFGRMMLILFLIIPFIFLFKNYFPQDVPSRNIFSEMNAFYTWIKIILESAAFLMFFLIPLWLHKLSDLERYKDK